MNLFCLGTEKENGTKIRLFKVFCRKWALFACAFRGGFCNHFAAFNSTSTNHKHITIWHMCHNVHKWPPTWAPPTLTHPHTHRTDGPSAHSHSNQQHTSKSGKQTFYKIFNFQIHKTNYEFESRKTKRKMKMREWACERKCTHRAYSSQHKSITNELVGRRAIERISKCPECLRNGENEGGHRDKPEQEQRQEQEQKQWLTHISIRHQTVEE